MDPEVLMDSARPNAEAILRTYKIPIILGAVSILCIIFSVFLLVKSSQNTTPIRFSSSSGEASSAADYGRGAVIQPKMLKADIEGAVRKPGVYELPYESRVEDLILVAGGLTDQVDSEWTAKNLNRAQKVTDGTKLYIPVEGENTTSHNGEILSRRDNTSYNISESVTTAGGLNTQVSINSSSQSELELLPGVGPVTATKILSNRPYMVIDELLTKKVIGASLFEKIKIYLVL